MMQPAMMIVIAGRLAILVRALPLMQQKGVRGTGIGRECAEIKIVEKFFAFLNIK